MVSCSGTLSKPLSSEPWVWFLDFGFWVLGFGFWLVLGFGFWFLVFGLEGANFSLITKDALHRIVRVLPLGHLKPTWISCGR